MSSTFSFISGFFFLFDILSYIFYTLIFWIHLSFPDFYWVNWIKTFNYIYFSLALSCTQKNLSFPHIRQVWYHILAFLWLVSSQRCFLLQHTGDHLALVLDCNHQKKGRSLLLSECPPAPDHKHFFSLPKREMRRALNCLCRSLGPYTFSL